MRRFILLLLLGLCLPWAAQAQNISGVTYEQGADGIERLRFTVSAPLSPNKVFTLSNPDRLVMDLPSVRASGVSLPANYAGRLIRQVRFGQFNEATSRIVLDLNAPVKIIGTATVPQATVSELVLDIAPVSSAAVPAQVPFGSTTPIPPAPTATVSQSEKPLIIIDPGHGGQDPGALGLGRTQEKHITMKFARALKAALLRTGRYRVALTREEDKYVMLPERVNIARRLKGDIFISLHADSNPRGEAKGLSVYTLSETSSDEEAAALAEHENKADIIAGLDLSTADADVASILIDLAQRETMNKSAKLADVVVKNLHPKIEKLPTTHRFAGFRVLKAPDIPSILVELGFLSNKQDERLLTSPEYETLVIGSFIKALDSYIAEQGVH